MSVISWLLLLLPSRCLPEAATRRKRTVEKTMTEHAAGLILYIYSEATALSKSHGAVRFMQRGGES